MFPGRTKLDIRIIARFIAQNIFSKEIDIWCTKLMSKLYNMHAGTRIKLISDRAKHFENTATNNDDRKNGYKDNTVCVASLQEELRTLNPKNIHI
jgi:hypothetical protein